MFPLATKEIFPMRMKALFNFFSREGLSLMPKEAEMNG